MNKNYKYIQNYNKEKYVEFRAWLDKDNYNKLINYIRLNYNSKSEFLKKVIDLLNIK